jgi:hypothetical protein
MSDNNEEDFRIVICNLPKHVEFIIIPGLKVIMAKHKMHIREIFKFITQTAIFMTVF